LRAVRLLARLRRDRRYPAIVATARELRSRSFMLDREAGVCSRGSAVGGQHEHHRGRTLRSIRGAVVEHGMSIDTAGLI
jgi:hypothetical protein